jgi:hypothetical protein
MSAYWAAVLGHLRDLGFTQLAKLQESSTVLFLRLFGDSGCNLDFTCTTYYHPEYNSPASDNFLQTPAQVKAGIVRGAQLSRGINATATSMRTASVLTSGSQLGPVWDSIITSSGGVGKINSEIFRFAAAYGTQVSLTGSIDGTTNRITFTGSHDYLDGDMIDFVMTVTGSFTELPIAADTTNCRMPSGKGHCRWYVKVISSTVIECYRDSALTDMVDFTANASNVRAGYFTVALEGTYTGVCNGVSCRGIMGTTAASHAAGSVIDTLGMLPSWTHWIFNPGFSYGHNAKVALAYAVTYQQSLTDTITGAIIRPRQVYDRWASNLPLQDQYGDNSSCNSVDNCGTNRWGWTPWRGPTYIRTQLPAAGQVRIRYVAPDGKACKVHIASSFSSSDDTTDTTDVATSTSRSQLFSGLTSGTHLYRITCSTGRVIGTVVVP